MFTSIRNLIEDAPMYIGGVVFIIFAAICTTSVDSYWICVAIIIASWTVANAISDLGVIGLCIDDIDLEDLIDEEEQIQDAGKDQDKE